MIWIMRPWVIWQIGALPYLFEVVAQRMHKVLLVVNLRMHILVWNWCLGGTLLLNLHFLIVASRLSTGSILTWVWQVVVAVNNHRVFSQPSICSYDLTLSPLFRGDWWFRIWIFVACLNNWTLLNDWGRLTCRSSRRHGNLTNHCLHLEVVAVLVIPTSSSVQIWTRIYPRRYWRTLVRNIWIMCGSLVSLVNLLVFVLLILSVGEETCYRLVVILHPIKVKIELFFLPVRLVSARLLNVISARLRRIWILLNLMVVCGELVALVSGASLIICVQRCRHLILVLLVLGIRQGRVGVLHFCHVWHTLRLFETLHI